MTIMELEEKQNNIALEEQERAKCASSATADPRHALPPLIPKYEKEKRMYNIRYK